MIAISKTRNSYWKQLPELEAGDLLFTYISAPIFRDITKATQCWTNHVSLITEKLEDDYRVIESIAPFSRTTTLNKSIHRSKNQIFAIKRLKVDLSTEEKISLIQTAEKKLNIPYDLGFNLNRKNKQFCSKFVSEIYQEALNIKLGNIESFDTLFKKNRNANLFIWRIWFLGFIPWQRQTITPASIWEDEKLQVIFKYNF